MGSDKSFVQYIVHQIKDAGEIISKSMFGEYAIYFNGKLIALVCDNMLFIKPTEAGKNFIKNIVEASPYPGAKPYYLIEDKLEDSTWLCELVKLTYNELPEPRLKKSKRKS